MKTKGTIFTMIVALIEKVYSFLWGDLIHIPLPGGGSVGISLLIILLIPTGIYFTVRTTFTNQNVSGHDKGADR